MSVSTYEIGHSWPAVARLPDRLPLAPDFSRPTQSSQSQVATMLSGRLLSGHLVIPGAKFTIPEQEFSVFRTEAGIKLESRPESSWPKILIELGSDLQEGSVKKFAVVASDNSVKGELLRTRVVFSMATAKEWSILLENNRGLRVTPHSTERTEPDEFLYRAKIYRKLTYVEKFFGLCFSLPETISSDEVQRIETIFRGITEGEFRGRAPAMLFKLDPSMIDLSKPPFSGIGEFSYEVGAPVRLFDQAVPVGRFTVHLEKAELANPRVVEPIRKGSREPIEARFEVLDNQVVYRFENYAGQARQHLRQQLDRFKQELALEEPQQLVDLVDEPIQGDVSRREATQIAVGWTFFTHLPDRYCPQEPEIDDTTGHWRVPIWLVYASGKGGPVGEVIIDNKTGEIVRHTPIDELRREGLALAEKILNA